MRANVDAMVLFTAFVGLLSLIAYCGGCTPDARRALLETALDATQCAIANMDLPNEKILAVCAVDAADADRILRIVGESRERAAKAALQGEARGRAAVGCAPR